ncbi:MAG TPA: DMT family transporter [Burkholderiales bacterium]|jgi:drug/metabolite transporter (DMT)-like permease|nr:DMT family transporter [Burkholderiales bacterium]
MNSRIGSLPPAVRGTLWMGGAVLSFSAMAVAVRQLLTHMAVFQILFLRTFIALLVVLAVAAAYGWFARLRTRRIGIHFLRNFTHFGGQYCWVYAIGALPLATVFAIEFTMPVWVALLAWWFLGERLNGPRLVMLALGLTGVLVILKPGVGVIHPAALVMLLGALCYAANLITTKTLTGTDSVLAILFWMNLIQTPLALIPALPQWSAPTLADAPWIAALAGGSLFAHFCMTRAFKLADATVVVPIDFMRLPLIAVVGAFAYGEALDPWVFVGAAIIFTGTYYSLSREARRVPA